MDRPSKDEVDAAIASVHNHDRVEPYPYWADAVLAAEVRALRAELAALEAARESNLATQERVFGASVARLTAKLARVEALCNEADDAEDSRVDTDVIRAALAEPETNSEACGVAGSRCEIGNECGRPGCPECQQ